VTFLASSNYWPCVRDSRFSTLKFVLAVQRLTVSLKIKSGDLKARCGAMKIRVGNKKCEVKQKIGK